ncbi:MAG: hypothetical protein LAT76_13210, partial [Schleiferiaceae bacterium]|nr:hypothetical protein [Schleiferiaceae bacterium]
PIHVPQNSIARIYSIGLLGEKQIELVLGDAPIAANPNDTLFGTQESGLMDGVNEKLNPIVQKTDLVLGSLNETLITLLDSTNQKGIRNVIANLDATTAALGNYTTANEKRLSQITADIAAIANNLKSNNANINALIENLTAISDSAKSIEMVRIAQKLEAAIAETNTLLSGINAGEGTLGLLANDPQLYEQLTLTSYQLNRLLIDLEQNPKRYINVSVFGKRTKASDQEAIDKQIEKNAADLGQTK